MSTKTAKQQDALTELLDLLTQNGKKQEAAELSALFSQFAAMETQYGKPPGIFLLLLFISIALHDFFQFPQGVFPAVCYRPADKVQMPRYLLVGHIRKIR